MTLKLTTAVAAAALLAGAAHAQQTQPAQTQSNAQTGAAVQAGQNTPARAGASATASTPATGAAASTPAAGGDLVATAQAAGQFNTLLKAAEATGLTPVLKRPGALTVFAPTDQAFAALPAGELDRLMQPANREELQKLLLAHVVNAAVPSSELAGKKGQVQNGAGAQLSIDGTSGVVVNGAKVVQADIRASNGIIHVVDKVILPGAAPASATAAPAPSAAAETSSLASTDTAEPVEQAEAAAPTQTAEAAPAAETAAAHVAATEAASAAPAANSNGPVADTPETRAKYPPQSRAGKRTAPRGD